MSSDVVVQVNNLGKRFKIYKKPWDRAREWVRRGARSYHADFWALKDISFELRRGEALGIIGQNGAGKSTLLKILNGAMYATEGDFRINGRVLSMLELGTGFNPELTGRQNIYNSAHLLGFAENYVVERIDDIETFADIGDFFDRPIKIYSSGMNARLAFSMFAFLDCDLLVIDEVLSVGDTFFTQKCYERLDQLRQQNTAMIMVTHNLSVIQQYCKHGIVMDKGRIIFAGAASEAAKHYFFINNRPNIISGYTGTTTSRQSHMAERSIIQRSPSEEGLHDWEEGTIDWPVPEAFLALDGAASIGEDWVRCTGIALCDDLGNPCQMFGPGQIAHWYYEFEALRDLVAPSGSVAITNDLNVRVHGKNSMNLGIRPMRPILKGMRMRFHQSIALNIAPGDYTFSIALGAMRLDDTRADLGAASADQRRFIANDIDRAGTFRVMWTNVQYLGLCDLPGDCELEISPPTETAILEAQPMMRLDNLSTVYGTYDEDAHR